MSSGQNWRNGWTGRRHERSPSRNSYRSGGEGEANETTTATRIQGSDDNGGSSSVAHQRKAAPIVIDSQCEIRSVAFLANGEHIVSHGYETRIQRWQVDDGREVGTLVDAESKLCGMVVSRDGRWIVGGTKNGFVEVWHAATNEKRTSWKAHNDRVWAVDVSQDGKVVSGSHDKTVSVWSLETGELLLGPFQHDKWVATVKISPNGQLVATATWERESVRIYDSRDGSLLVDLPIQVGSSSNNSLAWTGDGRRLFVLSRNDLIYCLDASNWTTLAKWRIHGNQSSCIAPATNGAFIAAASGSTVSFWDVSSQNQVGSTLCFTHPVWSMVISNNFHLVVCGMQKITLRSLRDMLPMLYTINDALNDLEQLRVQLAEAQQARQQSDDLIQSLRAQGETSNAKITQLEEVNQDLSNKLSQCQRATNDEKNTIDSLRADLDAQKTSSSAQIQDLRHQLDTRRDEANLLLRTQEECSNNEKIRFGRIIRAHEQKDQCEHLYAQGCVLEAAESLVEMDKEVVGNQYLSNWLTDFTRKCTNLLEKNGDEASAAGERDKAMAAYAASLSLSSLAPSTILVKWSRTVLAGCPARNALSATAKFKVPRFTVYYTICNVLEGNGRIAEAVECFHQMKNELPDDVNDDERTEWECDFRVHCAAWLVKLGDAARDAKKHEEAVGHYSEALRLAPTNFDEILLRYSNELIELDPSSHKGYEEKHAALHRMRHYGEAFEAFQSMLSKLEQSFDPPTQELRQQYLDITPLIRQAVQQAISHMPRLLIDTETGRLYDKKQQAAVFEELPVYDELRSSITSRTQLDLVRIQDEVKKFYRYVMFSHRWELDGEPVLQDVQTSTVYILEATSPNMKLQTLCRIVRKLGFKWVWSDTCCIDKDNNVVLQESLVAMFSWYRGSALTLVHLCGVWSHSQKPGHLRKSVWNSRVWTYQEYLAAETVQFYTEDWKPYLDLDIFNHKESPAIIEEMEPESGISIRDSALLRPGLDRVREKLSLAATRETTFVEDIAYSLLGIFNASIPVIYGERYRAIGRLLEHVLTGSGDVSILAWTGHSGEYNSCLPLNLAVYAQVVPPHIPLPMEMSDMDHVVTRLRSSPQVDHALLETLYHRLRYLPKLRMAASRLELPGIVFQISALARTVVPDPEAKVGVYRTTTSALGNIEIRTAEDLSGMTHLVLVHPWIRPLLHQEFVGGAGALDKTTQALRLLARLQQPFGALLLQQLSLMEYRRVAADSLIVVQIREEVPLAELIEKVTTVEIQ